MFEKPCELEKAKIRNIMTSLMIIDIKCMYVRKESKKTRFHPPLTVYLFIFFFCFFDARFVGFLVEVFSGPSRCFPFSALTLFPGLFTVPLTRMTDLLSRLKIFKLTSVYVPVYIMPCLHLSFYRGKNLLRSSYLTLVHSSSVYISSNNSSWSVDTPAICIIYVMKSNWREILKPCSLQEVKWWLSWPLLLILNSRAPNRNVKIS